MSSSNSGWFSKIFGGTSRRKASKSARRNFRFQFGGLDRLETRLAPTGVHAALESSHAHVSHEVEKVETHQKHAEQPHAEQHQASQHHKHSVHDTKKDSSPDHAVVASKLSLSSTSSHSDSTDVNNLKHKSIDVKHHPIELNHAASSHSVDTKIDDSLDAADDSSADDSADDKDGDSLHS